MCVERLSSLIQPSVSLISSYNTLLKNLKSVN